MVKTLKDMRKMVIFDFNRTIYDPEKKRLLPKVRFVLRILIKRGFSLYLVSRAENSRRKLIKSLDLQKYFRQIITCQEKGLEDFKKIANRRTIDQQNSFVIGDRVKEEIRFGNFLGLKTVWLKVGKFSEEKPKLKIEIPKFTVERLEKILEFIK